MSATARVARPGPAGPTRAAEGGEVGVRRLGTARSLRSGVALRVRLLLGCVVLSALALGGCELARIDVPGPDGGSDAGPDMLSDREFFDRYVQPLLDGSRATDASYGQCVGCHGDPPMVGAPGFIQTGSDYDRVLAQELAGGGLIVVPGDPAASAFYNLSLIGSGHPRQEWEGGGGPVEEWILREGDIDVMPVDAGPPLPTSVRTIRVPIVDGMEGRIPLDSVGAPGAVITFTPSLNVDVLTLRSVTLRAGSATVAVTEPALWVFDGTDSVERHRFTERPNYRATTSSPAILADIVRIDTFPPGGEVEMVLGTLSVL